MATKADRYEGIDGLKAYAVIGIALMHVLANGEYRMGGFVFERLIPSFTNLVFLFMIVSGFGMCCGYYQKFKDQKISVVDFYKKRYNKIWPYFALLCVLDFVMSPSKSALYEVFANLTLCQGLLPNMNISVIGVSWTLAVIFVFYLLFPFFCFLLESKKRAWLAFICAVIYNFVCGTYFFECEDKHSVLCNIFYRRRSDFPLSEGTGRVRIEAQGYRWSDFVDCRSCLFCIRRQYAHDAVLLCGSTGICPRLYNGGGYWSIQLPSSSAVSASRFTCATW